MPKPSSFKIVPPSQNPEAPSAARVNESNGNMLPPLILTSEQLFLYNLRDIYWAENHLLVTLPTMIEAASAHSLRSVLKEHYAITKTKVARLEEIFALLKQTALPKKCAALEGMAMSGQNIIQSTMAGTAIRDAAIIASGIQVENFEMTAYQALFRQAIQLGYEEVANLLDATLAEEREAKQQLMNLADVDK